MPKEQQIKISEVLVTKQDGTKNGLKIPSHILKNILTTAYVKNMDDLKVKSTVSIDFETDKCPEITLRNAIANYDYLIEERDWIDKLEDLYK